MASQVSNYQHKSRNNQSLTYWLLACLQRVGAHPSATPQHLRVSLLVMCLQQAVEFEPHASHA